MGNQQERQLTQARLAMLYDCEGYITLRMVQPDKHRKQGRIVPIICVSNTSQKLLDWVTAAFAMLELPHYIQWTKAHGLGKLPQWRLTVQGVGRVSKLLPHLIPYLVIKLENALLVQEFVTSRLQAKVTDSYSDRELNLALTARGLAQKGKHWEPESSETIRQIEQFREFVRHGNGSNDIVRSRPRKHGSEAEMTSPAIN